jgi:hypothetical protein
VNRFLLHLFLSGGRGYILASVPSNSLLLVFRGMQSDNPAERAAAFYEVGRLRLSSAPLLKEAYDAEPIPFVRTSILYAMKETDDEYWKSFCAALPEDRKPFLQKDIRTEKPFRF